MNTGDIWRLVDSAIRAGYFPGLEGEKYVLLLEVKGTGRAILHREEVYFALACPCRIWCCAGPIRHFVGDSEALPLDLSGGVRPPWTG